jgi:hypothetical protein
MTQAQSSQNQRVKRLSEIRVRNGIRGHVPSCVRN